MYLYCNCSKCQLFAQEINRSESKSESTKQNDSSKNIEGKSDAKNKGT